MRIKNKELRQRRHRKEQVIKAAQRDIRAQYAGKPAAEKGAAKPAAKAAAKPKKSPAKKKDEESPES